MEPAFLGVLMLLRLRDFLPSDAAWGSQHGAELRADLLARMKGTDVRAFGLNLQGVTQVDVTFCREAIVILAQELHAQGRGLCLNGDINEDCLENLSAACLVWNFPLIWWPGREWKILGPACPVGAAVVLGHALLESEVTTGSVIRRYSHLSAPNASNKLSELWRLGYLLRETRSAETGGHEHVYRSIRV